MLTAIRDCADYVLAGGVHCFGENSLRQQLNIIEGCPDFSTLAPLDPLAVDLITRMVCREAGRRLRIDGALLGRRVNHAKNKFVGRIVPFLLQMPISR